METIQYPTKTKAIKDHICNFCLEPIKKESTYLRSTYVYDNIYSWKSHEWCTEITLKLKMHDDCEYGVTNNDFIESIIYQYSKIMSETQNDIYESKDFIYPNFKDQLIFVLNYYNIDHDFQ